eukprot:CAMPEP_0198243438 /NCGR_PEP_ID=MMETSP1446-20131203/27809_1 /TAXON_ID=1461542 ORGANISM="Unidentified sp, Strain CCMP2111" /NCGR_SAMPLE_ID=MMETSP1446 /ASSEMBLY_ACC=CAM_ASM_001112 /LENGTH=262 /DNA_ID=CAMNT_0043927255 /DNA_START=211 /DNA_END=996 /DNA_ORIENTATION=+
MAGQKRATHLGIFIPIVNGPRGAPGHQLAAMVAHGMLHMQEPVHAGCQRHALLHLGVPVHWIGSLQDVLLPQPIVEVVDHLDADVLVNGPDVLGGHLCQPHRERVLLLLGVDGDGRARVDLVVDRRAGGSQPRAHDVRARQHELNRASVHPQLRHHVRVLVEDAQRREVRPVPRPVEERDVVHAHDLNLPFTFRNHDGLLLGHELVDGPRRFQPWVLLDQVGLDSPLHGRLDLGERGDVFLFGKPAKHPPLNPLRARKTTAK